MADLNDRTHNVSLASDDELKIVSVITDGSIERLAVESIFTEAGDITERNETQHAQLMCVLQEIIVQLKISNENWRCMTGEQGQVEDNL